MVKSTVLTAVDAIEQAINDETEKLSDEQYLEVLQIVTDSIEMMIDAKRAEMGE